MPNTFYHTPYSDWVSIQLLAMGYGGIVWVTYIEFLHKKWTTFASRCDFNDVSTKLPSSQLYLLPHNFKRNFILTSSYQKSFLPYCLCIHASTKERQEASWVSCYDHNRITNVLKYKIDVTFAVGNQKHDNKNNFAITQIWFQRTLENNFVISWLGEQCWARMVNGAPNSCALLIDHTNCLSMYISYFETRHPRDLER